MLAAMAHRDSSWDPSRVSSRRSWSWSFCAERHRPESGSRHIAGASLDLTRARRSVAEDVPAARIVAASLVVESRRRNIGRRLWHP